MDDLNEKLARLLSSPDSLNKIQSAMAALGGEGSAPYPHPAPPPPASPAPSGLPDLAMLSKLTPLLAGMGKDDDDTRLLRALRPYLHGPREKRLDEAVQLLRLSKLLPLLQQQGVLTGGKKEEGSDHGG